MLVKWKGLLESDCTWENKQRMQRQFVTFDFEDKVNFKAAGNVMYEALHPPIMHQYKRRNKASAHQWEERMRVQLLDKDGLNI